MGGGFVRRGFFRGRQGGDGLERGQFLPGGFQFAGQLWQVIEKINDLQKRFREAKSDHKEDSDEIWNILQVFQTPNIFATTSNLNY